MKKKILYAMVFLFILLSALFLFYFKFYNQEKQTTSAELQNYETSCGKYQKEEVGIDSKIFSVDVADDACKQTLGLSGKTHLNEDEGMIFVFEKSGNYGFWMKDMNFPLDILWIDDNSNVVGIEKDLATSTYPEPFGGEYLAKYVLEVSAGNSLKNNIKVGDKIIFSKNNL